MGIISQLRPGSDLSRITLPTFILERKSMLERITNQLQHYDILLAAEKEEDPVQRFLLVLKWYLSGWHITPKAVKKPLNPVLGEYFTCYWDLPDKSKAYYVSEQTSHHPPKSSYFYSAPSYGIRIDGKLVPKSRFLGNSAASMMEGVTHLQFANHRHEQNDKKIPEKYSLTQPNMYARGILFGKFKYEMGDHSIVKCPSTGLIADVEFKTKGFISGTYNAIFGEIKNESTGEVLYELTGKWNEVMEIKDVRTGKKSVFFDAFTAKPVAPKVRPIEEQGEFESRRLWKKVTDALGQRDHEVATEEKYQIENSQRVKARQREEEGLEFHPKLFKAVDDELEFEIYKPINIDWTPEQQVEAILSIAPILPGQNFGEHFEIPAHKKHEDEIKLIN